MNKWLILIILGLLVCLAAEREKANKAIREWQVAAANVKAYDKMLGDSEKKDAALQLTVEQLKTYQDSILKELNATKRELKIKDKDLKVVEYVASTFTKVDTLTLNDTIFKEPSFQMDTTITDQWYKLNLGLAYPSTIFIKPEFKSQKHIIVSTKKETIKPPKKFFLLRWFQKKHKILRVDVVEKNPYVKDEVSRYVEIIK